MKPKSPFENLNKLANKAVENGWFKGGEKKVVPIETKDKDMDRIKLQIDALLKTVFTEQGLDADKLPNYFEGTFTDAIPYETLSNNHDTKNFGKYEHGTEFYDTNILENAKVEVKDFADMLEQPRFEVFKEAQKYIESEKAKGRNLVMPGFDYWKYLLENPGKAPQSMKDGKCYFMGNAALCNVKGAWSIPCVNWYGSKFDWHSPWLDNELRPFERVVFLEIIP